VPRAVTRIIGIDPGSQITGYGIIDVQGAQTLYVSSGCIRTEGGDLPQRLRVIFEGVRAVMADHSPAEMAVEQVFMHRNPDSALKLGQARGAAICAGVLSELPVAEYTARQVKLAIVGTGAAAKEQIQHMVRVLLGLSGTPQVDAADALAVALCHAHMRQTLGRLGGEVRGARGGRWR
jgi:crossover junction endodeoxyribonuclease RuvC